MSASSPRRQPTRLSDLLYVVVAFVVIYFAFSWGLESPPAQIMISDHGTVVVLKADRRGHFRGDGSINGLPVHFLVDTGASYLSIPEKMSATLGLEHENSPANQVTLETAAGKVIAYKVVIDRVRFVGIQQDHVAAVVVPKLQEPLLGMNFLKKLSMSQKSGEMRLTVD
ncbi:MAG: TIGR02281 family clan AA aspartic protease [Gammaproteobacteria bacterium]|jgi:aspartyl protease family protein|nr:TIGR02281 family clan AA aspartic protease [Gammaproteobacteria bacterium]MBT3489545.1 TIGR02281 family clan AA aspartic protease [Gammaproteobacteria bacterium]MBT3845292.1 TIGR02281 family clan AA aspartic protease [Gammaproteobacteria bacterium]MBT3893865.1 TIGR02281 family clan AA aspartic protease [Gammaproteobacteria bacterium]MBT4299965.1 TIGR02281 family clan AA aspartic protease [Gammaproteobacteria bacterium]